MTNEEFIKYFKCRIKTDKIIEIDEEVKNRFENQCLKNIKVYANKMNDWRNHEKY